MTTNRVLCATALLLAALLSARGTARAETLDELLAETKSARAAEAVEETAREQEFLARRDQQKQIVADAQRAWDAANARSQKLSEQFDANEAALTELEAQLKAREGNLGELFGVTRQAAGESSASIFNSLTSGQFPGRDAFLTRLAKSKVLPTTSELEDLAFELLREIAETGRVARFNTELIGADGEPDRAEVVRIGGFIAMAGDRFLSYVPAVGKFSVLPRQPSHEYRAIARRVSEAKQGTVEAVVDPSRGALLELYVQRPNFWERIQRGEEVGYVIIAVGVIGAACAAWQLVYLVRVRRRLSWQLGNLDTPKRDNPLGRILSAFRGDPTAIESEVEVVELRISEAVLREVPLLERFQAFLRLAVAAGPLLGLIGTVIGMIITFQSITESGSSDPKLMAAGIGQAMIATVLGLGIAIPLLFVNAALSSLSQSIVQVLDEQSNGLLAEHIERKIGDVAVRREQHA
ncbi:MAG TPA: MotA/TolQ/ExbB proton channel family protein [Myxococcota bacterium]|nr:MotA/TolQ/ExbB proton channel family protein [Myxococcota bacterium]